MASPGVAAAVAEEDGDPAAMIHHPHTPPLHRHSLKPRARVPEQLPQPPKKAGDQGFGPEP